MQYIWKFNSPVHVNIYSISYLDYCKVTTILNFLRIMQTSTLFVRTSVSPPAQSLGQSGARKFAGLTMPFCLAATFSMYSITASTSEASTSTFLKNKLTFNPLKIGIYSLTSLISKCKSPWRPRAWCWRRCRPGHRWVSRTGWLGWTRCPRRWRVWPGQQTWASQPRLSSSLRQGEDGPGRPGDIDKP